MARKFFYVCAGMLMLALSYHFGFTTASAQAPGNPVVAIAHASGSTNVIAVTSGGDAYTTPDYGVTWYHTGNVFSGGPVPTQRETWGQLKSRYAPDRTAKPGATNR